MRSTRVITPPAIEPVSLAEAKGHLRIDDSSDDAKVTLCLVAARRFIEGKISHGLITQTVRDTLDAWEELGGAHADKRLRNVFGAYLDRVPVASVTSVKVLRSGAFATLVAGTDYVLESECRPARILPVGGTVLPTPDASSGGGIEIDYVVGVDTAAAVEEDIKAAILFIVGTLYENRQTEITGAIVSRFEDAVAMLLADHVLRTRS